MPRPFSIPDCEHSEQDGVVVAHCNIVLLYTYSRELSHRGRAVPSLPQRGKLAPPGICRRGLRRQTFYCLRQWRVCDAGHRSRDAWVPHFCGMTIIWNIYHIIFDFRTVEWNKKVPFCPGFFLTFFNFFIFLLQPTESVGYSRFLCSSIFARIMNEQKGTFLLHCKYWKSWERETSK